MNIETEHGGPTTQNKDFGGATPAQPLDLDTRKYAHLLTNSGMDDSQTQALLEAVWTIMKGFVDLGIDVGKADICGLIFGAFNEHAEGGADKIYSAHPIKSGDKREDDRKGRPV